LKILKYVLSGNFWCFLLVLSGVIDMVFGLVMYVTPLQFIEEPPFPIFAVCLGVGFVYFSAGIAIAIAKTRTKHPRPPPTPARPAGGSADSHRAN